jgi:hypothetical protein
LIRELEEKKKMEMNEIVGALWCKFDIVLKEKKCHVS